MCTAPYGLPYTQFFTARSAFYSLKEALSLIHLINHTVLLCFHRCHPVVPIGVLTNLFHRLTRVVGDNLLQLVFQFQYLFRRNLYIRRLTLNAPHRLVNHHP